MRIAAFGYLAACLVLIPSVNALAQVAPATERIGQSGRWFTDAAGRIVTIRGGNVTLPTFDAAGEPRWTAETPQRMAEQGFNGIRLVVFFRDLMPRPGQVDPAYVERIARTVAAYKAAGIYTMIDFHQDEYSPLTGVRGMPDWAVFTDGYTKMPGISFPMGYFKDPAVQRAFDNFWKNHPVAGTGKGVQDLYVEGLAAVARRFRDEPAVLGIDVFNEPSTGSRCAQADPAVANCPHLEEELLKPFYAKLAASLNRAAPNMIVFYEPFMLQGALGIPINTPIAGAAGRRGFSYHNYGPVKATRATVNRYALDVANRYGAAIVNTEWGFSNDPAEVASQAADFDAIHMSWLAWTRGPFESLVDHKLPDRGNGNRVAVLRSYARPYAEATAGTPDLLAFDGASGTLTYRYATKPLTRRKASSETRIRIPAIQYPNGYQASAEGGDVVSAQGAPVLRVRSRPGAPSVTIKLTRVGALPPLPVSKAEPDRIEAGLRALPPIPAGKLTRNSLLGHVYLTPGGRDVLERQVPGMLTGLSHVAGWEKMTLAGIQQFASGTLNEAKISAIEADLAMLNVTPGPVRIATEGRLSIDSLASDLLADPRARAILDKEVPGFATSSQQGLYPQTRLRGLQAAMPDLLTDAALKRIEDALAQLK